MPFSTHIFLYNPHKRWKCCCFPARFPGQEDSWQWLSQRWRGTQDPWDLAYCKALAFSRELAHGWRKTRLVSPLFRSVILALGQITWQEELWSPGKPSPEFKVRAEKRAKVMRSRTEFFNGKSLTGPAGRAREGARGGRGCVFWR